MGWIVGMRACGVCVFEHAEYVAPVRVEAHVVLLPGGITSCVVAI